MSNTIIKVGDWVTLKSSVNSEKNSASQVVKIDGEPAECSVSIDNFGGTALQSIPLNQLEKVGR
jgi:hypothetical protein